MMCKYNYNCPHPLDEHYRIIDEDIQGNTMIYWLCNNCDCGFDDEDVLE